MRGRGEAELAERGRVKGSLRGFVRKGTLSVSPKRGKSIIAGAVALIIILLKEFLKSLSPERLLIYRLF